MNKEQKRFIKFLYNNIINLLTSNNWWPSLKAEKQQVVLDLQGFFFLTNPSSAVV